MNARIPFYDFCEYAVIYYKHYNSLIHEILHLFGAADLYFPKEVSDITKEMFPESIMFNSAYNLIDDFTKYVTGIHDEPSALAKSFMEKTKELTGEYIDSFLKEQWTDEFRRVRYSNGMIYEGNFKNTMREGMGKVYYTDGSIYEGEFRDNECNGHGKLIYPSGKVYEGEFKNGKIVKK
ncbi:hypothetical protein [Anaerofustis butyriciformans]|uniref:hypothetical protein n=1 Tax=Anaerofustis butyriciformans TaxID=3108533 RepID=UPI003F88CF9A